MGSATPIETGSLCTRRAATSRSLQIRKPARVAVMSTAFDHLWMSASPFPATKRWTTAPSCSSACGGTVRFCISR